MSSPSTAGSQQRIQPISFLYFLSLFFPQLTRGQRDVSTKGHQANACLITFLWPTPSALFYLFFFARARNSSRIVANIQTRGFSYQKEKCWFFFSQSSFSSPLFHQSALHRGQRLCVSVRWHPRETDCNLLFDSSISFTLEWPVYQHAFG